MRPDPEKSAAKEFQTQALILGTLVALMWGVELMDLFWFHNRLNQWGIRPRQLGGLIGIPLAPFLHGGVRHLMANTMPFITLGWLVMLRRTQDFWAVSLISLLLGGLGTWLTGGENTIHIGASGIIFGYLGFLLLRGYFERSRSAIAFSVLIFVMYGGLVWGILPWQQRGISWQSHCFGFLSGVCAAWVLTRPPRSLR